MWIELGIFVLVIVFALWQIHDVKQERLKREARQREAAGQGSRPDPDAGGANPGNPGDGGPGTDRGPG